MGIVSQSHTQNDDGSITVVIDLEGGEQVVIGISVDPDYSKVMVPPPPSLQGVLAVKLDDCPDKILSLKVMVPPPPSP